MSKIVEKSKAAKSVGGPAMIRKLPKTDRLKIGIKVAEELGNEAAVKTCAKKAVEYSIREHDFSDAAEIAQKYGFEEDSVKKIALSVVNASMSDIEIREVETLSTREKPKCGAMCGIVNKVEPIGIDYHKECSSAAVISREYGFTKQMRKAANILARELLIIRKYDAVDEVAQEYGLEEVMEEAVLYAMDYFKDCGYTYGMEIAERYRLTEENLIKFIMGEIAKPDVAPFYYANLAELAKKHGLEGQMREAALKSFERHMEWDEYDNAAEVAEKYGLDEQRKEAMRKVVERYMHERRYSKAAETAKEHGLDKEMRNAALKIMDIYLRKGEFSSAEKTAEEYGLYGLDDNDIKTALMKTIKPEIKKQLYDEYDNLLYSEVASEGSYSPYFYCSNSKARELRDRNSCIRTIAEKSGIMADVRKIIIETVEEIIMEKRRNENKEIKYQVGWKSPFSIIASCGLGKEDVIQATMRVFERYIESKQYHDAVKIAMRYRLGKENWTKAALKLFAEKMEGLYNDQDDSYYRHPAEETAKLIDECQLEQDDAKHIVSGDKKIGGGVLKAVSYHIRNANFSVVSRFIEVCGLEEDFVKRAALSAFEREMNDIVKLLQFEPCVYDYDAAGGYRKAAEIAGKYGLAEEMKTAAEKAIEKDIEKKNYSRAEETAEKYGLAEQLEAIRAIKGILSETPES